MKPSGSFPVIFLKCGSSGMSYSSNWRALNGEEFSLHPSPLHLGTILPMESRFPFQSVLPPPRLQKVRQLSAQWRRPPDFHPTSGFIYKGRWKDSSFSEELLDLEAQFSSVHGTSNLGEVVVKKVLGFRSYLRKSLGDVFKPFLPYLFIWVGNIILFSGCFQSQNKWL